MQYVNKFHHKLLIEVVWNKYHIVFYASYEDELELMFVVCVSNEHMKRFILVCIRRRSVKNPRAKMTCLESGMTAVFKSLGHVRKVRWGMHVKNSMREAENRKWSGSCGCGLLWRWRPFDFEIHACLNCHEGGARGADWQLVIYLGSIMGKNAN